MKNNNIDYEKVIYDYLNKPSKLLILNLIEKIYINEDGIIDIYYKGKK